MTDLAHDIVGWLLGGALLVFIVWINLEARAYRASLTPRQRADFDRNSDDEMRIW